MNNYTRSMLGIKKRSQRRQLLAILRTEALGHLHDVIVYTLCLHHVNEARVLEDERLREEQGIVVERWLVARVEQVETCSVCAQLEQGSDRPQPIGRVAQPLPQDIGETGKTKVTQ